jgi:ankyrin repeat protein
VYKENGEWDGSTLAHAAAKQAHERLIYHILMWRPDEVNALDALHSTPLHRAVQNGRIAVVKALCLEGSWCLRAATLDKFGMMPLDYALGLNSDDHVKLGIQKLLLERPEVEEYLQRFSNGFFTAVVTILLVVTLIVTHTYGVRLQQPLLANSFCNNSDLSSINLLTYEQPFRHPHSMGTPIPQCDSLLACHQHCHSTALSHLNILQC